MPPHVASGESGLVKVAAGLSRVPAMLTGRFRDRRSQGPEIDDFRRNERVPSRHYPHRPRPR